VHSEEAKEDVVSSDGPRERIINFDSDDSDNDIEPQKPTAKQQKLKNYKNGSEQDDYDDDYNNDFEVIKENNKETGQLSVPGKQNPVPRHTFGVVQVRLIN